MSYCIKNDSKEPVNVLGITIAPGKTSRELFQHEVEKFWSEEHSENIRLVPLLMESVGRFETPISKPEEASGASRRGRQKKGEEETE